MKKQDIKDIIDELIELEPSLTEHRKELEKNVEAIMKAKPNLTITPAFKKKLLSELQSVIATTPLTPSPFSAMHKYLYALGGAAVASVALYVTMINPTTSFKESDDGNAAMNTADQMDYAVGRGGGIPQMMDSRMIAPGEPHPYNSVEYIYEGEIELEEQALNMFKRLPLKASSKANILNGTFVSELMDTAAFPSLSVVNVSLTEPGDEPLLVNVDFNEGNISMNRQINYNQRPESKCRDEACFQQYRLQEKDMISDSRAITIANDFLEKIGVDTTNFGEPMMQNDWRLQHEKMDSSADFYFPDQLSITYPYIIDGMPVYDEWGNPSGMSVNIDVRLRAAIGMWGLRTMQTEEERIEITDNMQDIIDLARTGGMRAYIQPEAKLLQATLGTPRMVYTSYYQWDEDRQIGYETYVPALYFPITSMPEESYEVRKAVVVPIGKDIIEERKPMPMPVEPLEAPAVMEKE